MNLDNLIEKAIIIFAGILMLVGLFTRNTMYVLIADIIIIIAVIISWTKKKKN